ncbi:C-3 sterol dehydrogenase/C-4 decarboxylase family protein [Xylariomycetidae sp. FL0641]|nr:C-3 sterol dehydrogenase/C-4 decarboxylase family protein [Xylariomycetidae sp. FL0641]
MVMKGTENDMSLSPVVVTGGCGFIGFHLVTGLLECEPDCQIHVIDVNTERNRVPGVTYDRCDIASATEVEAVVSTARPRTLFHLACPDTSVHQSTVYRRVNVDGTRNLLTAARNVGTVRALVNCSTSSVILDNRSDLIEGDETFPVLTYPAQKRVYALTKAEAEAEILRANRAGGDSSMLTLSLWPATAFGERDTVFMSKMVAACRAGRGRMQTGPGKNKYDFIYISNLVDAHILAAQALTRAYGEPPPSSDMRVDGQCFVITNNERVLFWDFAVKPFAFICEWSVWLKSFGTKHSTVTRESVHLTTITRTLNGEKAMRVLGYRPKVSISDGLQRAGTWFAKEEGRLAEAKKTV